MHCRKSKDRGEGRNYGEERREKGEGRRERGGVRKGKENERREEVGG